MKKTYRLTIELGGNYDFDTGQISLDQQYLLDSFLRQLREENRQRNLATLQVKDIEEETKEVVEDKVKELENQKSEKLSLLKKSKNERVKANLLDDIAELKNKIGKLKSREGKEED